MNGKAVCVVGLGHVGLPLSVCIAHRGFKVVGIDANEELIDTLKKGNPHIHEPGLKKLLRKALKDGALYLTSDYREAIKLSDITFITVGTPTKLDGSVDLSHVKDAALSLGEALARKRSWHLVVVRSTVPPGTTGGLIRNVLEDASGRRCGEDLGLCMNPEFLREGSAIRDVLEPDRIIIGEFDKTSGNALELFYKEFHRDQVPPILRTSLVNAELIKYASNCFLAVKISYINQIARLCERLPGADIVDVAKGMGLDKRISMHFLKAGLGWGGPCLPKDTKAFIEFARRLGEPLPLVESALAINEEQPLRAISMLESVLGELRGKKVAVLGLAFKPNTDDMRGAVSIKLIRELLRKGAKVVAFDPVAIEDARKILGQSVSYANSVEDCIRGADCVIIVTEWDEFRRLKPEDFLKLMKRPVVIDGRRIYNPGDFPPSVTYRAIGLGLREP